MQMKGLGLFWMLAALASLGAAGIVTAVTMPVADVSPVLIQREPPTVVRGNKSDRGKWKDRCSQYPGCRVA